MNALYHIAILEGYLAHHPELPRNVQDAIVFLKQATAEKPIAVVQPTKKRKKPRLTPEQRQKQLAQLAQMREKYKATREAKKAAP